MTSFCRLPWQGLDISPQGDYRPCCKYRPVGEPSITAYFNGIRLQQLKDEFIAGIRPKECARCWNDEDAGTKSKRQIDFDNYLKDLPFDDRIRIISFPFGNICNLACRHCKSFASSKWLDTEKQVTKIFPSVMCDPHQRYYKDKKLIDSIKELSKDAVLIEFPGGEPFVTGLAEHKDYLRFLIEHHPEEKSLHYTTNCTIFPDEEFWNLWSHFKNVDIQLSLDGTYDKFEYMRWPGLWSEVYPNVKRYQEYQICRSNLQLSISHTVGILNVYYVDEFVNWCQSENLPAPYIGLVSHPMHYNISNLPHHAKNIVAERLALPETQHVKSYMMQPGSEVFKLFLQWTDTLDKMRDQSFNTTFPEFSLILNQ